MKRKIIIILSILAGLNQSYGQNKAQDTIAIDTSAIAVEMDSVSDHTDMPITMISDTVGIDTSAIAIDMDSNDASQVLFRIIDPLLPYIELEQLSDSVYQFVRANDDIYGKIQEVTGDKKKVLFKLYDNYRWNETHPYTFGEVYEYILTDELDIIVMVSSDPPSVYITYCSPKLVCNHLAYLVEFDTLGRYSIFEQESRNGADVAMFNYTLDHVSEASGTYIYPINELQKTPKKNFWHQFGKIATSVAGSVLVAGLLMLLLAL